MVSALRHLSRRAVLLRSVGLGARVLTDSFVLPAAPACRDATYFISSFPSSVFVSDELCCSDHSYTRPADRHFVSLGSGASGSQGKSTFSILRTCQMVSSGCAVLHSQQRHVRALTLGWSLPGRTSAFLMMATLWVTVVLCGSGLPFT